MAAVVTVSVVSLVLLMRGSATNAQAINLAMENASDTPVTFAQVREIISQRCITCHSANPTDDVWRAAPNGVMFDTPQQIRQHAERIKVRAVDTSTMPLADKTKMTFDERVILSRWLKAGANVD